MFNKSCLRKRILAFAMVLCLLPVCAPAALAENYAAAVYSDSLPVYADPYCTQKVADLGKYTAFTVTGVNGEVARISYGGYTLYTAAAGIRSVEEFAKPAQANQNTYVFESANIASRRIAIGAGARFNLLATNGSWAMIENAGIVGYTNKNHVSLVQAEDPFQPATPAPETGNTAITGSGNVVIETIEASVAATQLPVYQSASAASRRLGTLYYGEKITVYAYNADWAYIRKGNAYGFCALNGLVRGSITAPETQTPSTDNTTDILSVTPVTVTAPSVAVYAAADTASSVLGTLTSGAQVNLVQSSGNWAYIELNGNYGYCALDALTKTSELTPDAEKQPLGTATVITATSPLADSPTGENIIATLSMGDTVTVYDHGDGVALVSFGEKRGYVVISSLSAKNYTSLREGSSGAEVSNLSTALLSLGYFDGEVTSNFTTKTTEAVKRIQAACGKEQTGVADEALLRVIYSGNAPQSPILSVSLAKGSKGDNVKRIQDRLLALGYLSIASSVDGDYGTKTANAVSLFQQASGASATGAADAATIRALYNPAAVKLPSGGKPADYQAPASSGSSSNSGSVSSGIASTTSSYNSNMSNAEKLEYVIYVAQQQLGKKYVFGSTGPNTFDCSGLTYYCFKKIGVTLKRTAYSDGYNNALPKIEGFAGLKRGDLVFFNTVSDSDLSDHIGIYLGQGYFIHASSGAAKVIVSDLSSGYYNRVYSWGRRVLQT